MSALAWFRRRPAELWAALLLTLGTLSAFCQVVNYDFVNYDDPVYVYGDGPGPLLVQGGLFSVDHGFPVFELAWTIVGCSLLTAGAYLIAWRRYGVAARSMFRQARPICVSLWLLIASLNLLRFETIESAFEAKVSGHWHPLTMLSLALDFSLFGLDARGYHLTNLLLHLASTLLLFWVLRLSTGSVWRSAAVAGLFAWHPLHVESVAWITERKDVLSTFFWMLTMLAYVKYVPRRAAHERCWRPYALTIFFFVLGLLSKPMLVTLPCVLLLWDYWPLGRLMPGRVHARPFATREHAVHASVDNDRRFGPPRRFVWLVVEKLPLFVLALASGIWTTRVMQETTRRSREIITLPGRVQNGLLAAVTLLRKMVWPSDLAVHYPALRGVDVSLEATLAGVFLAVCSAGVWLLRRRWPFLLMGWLWYLGTLTLVVLRLQAGSFSWADRYTYVPMIGIFIALVWGSCAWLERFKALLIVGWVSLLLVCLALTWQQVKIWEDSETLWKRTLAVTDNNYLAEFDLALHLEDKQRPEEALPHFEAAARMAPHIPKFRNRLYIAQRDLGKGLLEQGRPVEARKHLLAASEGFRQLASEFPENKNYANDFEATEKLLHEKNDELSSRTKK